MADGVIYQNDEGTKLEFDIEIDVSHIVSASLTIMKPDESKLTVDCEIDGDNNVIYYNTASGDLAQVGTYKLQPYVELDDEWKGRGAIVKIDVKPIL